MKKEIKISESEWSIMEVLWKNPMCSIGDIKRAIANTGWSDSTIKTLVRRLVSKGVVAINDDEVNYRYYPLLPQNECRLKETKSFINRVYDGSVSMLVTNLVVDSALSEKETEELMSLIDKMKKGK